MIAPSLSAVTLATCGTTLFVAALFAGSLLMPGRLELGANRSDGSRIAYRLNGLSLFLLTTLAALCIELAGWRLGRLYELFWSLLIAANIFAFTLSAVLVWTGSATTKPGLRSFFYGALRDPALLGVDLKLFSYRPSLIGLIVVAIGCVSYQFETLGDVTLAMALWFVMVAVYLLNYFQFEHGMLHTWDIVEERFGWMLVWGDYVLVPFFYALPGLLLAQSGADVPAALVILCGAVYVFGFCLFRGANQQKHAFRRDPSVRIWGRCARTIENRLLVSGFWGIGRKLNYTGELCIYVAWTALAGWSSPIAWLLPLWLASLLVHRAARDDRRCRAKYGAVWDEYCRAARFRMDPSSTDRAGRLAMLYQSIDAEYGWPSLLVFSLSFGLGLYAAVASLAYAYYFRRGRARFMPDYRPNRAELLHAIRWSVYGTVGNALLLLPIQLLVAHGYSRVYADFDACGWAYLPFSLVMVVVFAETCIYWIHRALHRQPLYRWLHHYHHRYREPTPAASFSFHPLDSLAQSTPYHIFVFLLPLHDAIYTGLIGLASFWALSIHTRVCWVPPTVINNTGCHTAHHWYYRYNYGNYFTLWDRLAGTYFDPAGLPERFFASKYGWRRAAAPPVLTDAGNKPPAPAP